MPVFLGGGGGRSNEDGWYAVLVCILRFDDICRGREESRWGTWWQRRGVFACEEANRERRTETDVKGAQAR